MSTNPKITFLSLENKKFEFLRDDLGFYRTSLLGMFESENSDVNVPISTNIPSEAFEKISLYLSEKHPINIIGITGTEEDKEVKKIIDDLLEPQTESFDEYFENLLSDKYLPFDILRSSVAMCHEKDNNGKREIYIIYISMMDYMFFPCFNHMRSIPLTRENTSMNERYSIYYHEGIHKDIMKISLGAMNVYKKYYYHNTNKNIIRFCYPN